METSITGTRWVDRQKNDMINKARGIKQSVSPDKYQIGNNLVVNLAESIKKPNDVQIRMNQTQYNKQGGKANFFPSTATTTTNGSSGQGSSDPRRTTDAGSR